MTVHGAPIDAEWMREHAGKVLEAREAAQAAQRAEVMHQAEERRQAKLRAGAKPTDELIEAIRDRLDLAGELVRHGYEKRGDRYLYAGSETGIGRAHPDRRRWRRARLQPPFR